jgi:hypothetical protein
MAIVGPAKPATVALIEAIRTLCYGEDGDDVRSAIVNMLAMVCEWAISVNGGDLEAVYAEIQGCCDEAKEIARINAADTDANPAND